MSETRHYFTYNAIRATAANCHHATEAKINWYRFCYSNKLRANKKTLKVTCETYQDIG